MSCLYLPNLINFLNNDIIDKINEKEIQYNQQQKSNEIINKLLESNKYTLNPNLKIQEDTNKYQITALLPNFNKDEVNIEVKNGRLVISAYREEPNNNTNDNQDESITIKKYKKTIDISNKNLDIQSIKASYNNNTLNIIIQKLNDSLSLKIQIES
ncbi:hypothetical protein DICPUDRAFT_153226 [Dictyostelium purpureum]|uniref:SHSP domain-containing protein n=1 Tax=Dictyostelium purpureum TaxID=5786 RepID=F0ZNC9_DICPU|nr:uncharacterized protein DICPUDRAFT_153226 [Dictyostelium purpureum]EGC34540.1 hypothetical protein DICPUDRAFT_153226 [Dictyostelium purpureum]|eukprot:XP_003288916.1 hypothetical protein DICPUDRAFT_153226 [Dictyostelium purpureum]